MKRIAVGLILGAVLGALDGATSWFTPEVRAMLVQIIIGSMVKDALVGVLAGIFGLKIRSMAACVGFGASAGFALAFLVAYLQHAHYVEILIPGTLVGAILGYATQKSGTAPATTQLAPQ
jgi:hypothetical protein